jgi:uncharacterized protein (DUF433 family)
MEVVVATPLRVPEYPHIVRTPGVRGGRARIDGTRICVVDMALVAEQGMRPEEVLTHFSSRPLTLAEVHAALGYHHDHPEELEDYLQRAEHAEPEIEAATAEYLRRSRL